MNATVDPAAGGAPLDAPLNAMPPGTTVGDFEVIRIIGEGGFGIVYEALDHTLHRRVAIKEYMPSSLAKRRDDHSIELRSEQCEATFGAGLKSFVNEAQLLAQFEHPALVKVFRFWEQNHTAYMVMPLYEGRTLRDVLRDNPRPDENWLKALLAPLLDALEILHTVRCYHRDIAPDNILVLNSGNPVLLDFGAARRIIGDMTQGVTVILKPGFAPIEQYADDPTLKQGPWTDIYALSAVIRLAITGKAAPTSVTRMVTDPLRPLADTVTGYSRDFLQAIDRGLAVRPDDRPQSIADFRHALGIRTLVPSMQTFAPSLGSAANPPSGGTTTALRSESPPLVNPLGPGLIHTAGRLGGLSTAGLPLPPDSELEETLPDLTRRREPSTMTASDPTGSGSMPAYTGGMRSPNSTKVLLVIGGALTVAIIVIVSVFLVMQTPAPSVPKERLATLPPSSSNFDRASQPVAAIESAPPTSEPRVPEPAATAAPATADNRASRSQQGADADSASPPPVAPVLPTARVVLDIKPWGEVLVDGRSRGLSPPLKALTMPEGKYRIEIRNPASKSFAKDIEVKGGRNMSITHTFQ